MSDEQLLRHLTFQASAQAAPIPWPKGSEPLAAAGSASPSASSQQLPKADVLVITWTAAEAQALADVLTPGHPSSSWQHYDRLFASRYAPHLTGRSPARQAKCEATYWPTDIGPTRVICVHSNLHLSTDDATLPVRALFGQLIGDVKPKLVITTGTAGGIGADVVEGDVLVANRVRFHCTKRFADQSWASSEYTGGVNPPTYGDLTPLFAANAARLLPVATRAPQVWTGKKVLTTDYFAYDNSENTYGLRTYDDQALMVEMDDAVLGLACAEDIPNPPEWLSIRNASDPQIQASVGTLAEQSASAERIYEHYGYWTTVGSAITTWATITGLFSGA